MEELFINRWHNLKEFTPSNGDNVFFYLPEKKEVYSGRYSEARNNFRMVDGQTFSESEVECWRYVNPKLNHRSYPKNGDRIAVPLKEGMLTGIYNDKKGKLGIVEIDPIFTGCEKYMEENSVDFADTDGWTDVPQEPTQEMMDIADVDASNKPMWNGMAIDPKDVDIKPFPGGSVNINDTSSTSNEKLANEMGQVSPTLDTGIEDRTETKVGRIKVDPNTGIPEHDTWSEISFNGTVKEYH